MCQHAVLAAAVEECDKIVYFDWSDINQGVGAVIAKLCKTANHDPAPTAPP